MNQYIVGKELIKISDIKNEVQLQNKIFASERPDNNFMHEHLVINHSTFVSIGFKDSKFVLCDLSFCVFIDCYFKKTIFDNVKFLGCKFINCKLDDLTLISCDFQYATFENCFIEFDTLYPNLPRDSNKRWDITRNIAMQCLKLGYSEQYRKYFFQEKEASEQHYWEMFRRKEKFYKNHYGFWDGFLGLFKLIGSKIDKVLWGYGESIYPLVIVMALFVFLFSLLFFNYNDAFLINGTIIKSLTWTQSLYISLANFFTISTNLSPAVNITRSLSLVENIIGTILIGFFIAGLFRYINRR